MQLADLVDQTYDDGAWRRARCARCGGYHPAGFCPAKRGIQIVVDHLPGYGWRGCVCLPQALGDVIVRQELAPGMLPSLAKDRAPHVDGPGGEEVGILPLILAALSTPQGQQAMSQLAAYAGQGIQALGEKYAQQPRGIEAQPPEAPPMPSSGPSRGQIKGAGMRALWRSLSKHEATRDASDDTTVRPELRAVVAAMPFDLAELPHGTMMLGERLGEEQSVDPWSAHLGADLSTKISHVPVPDPHGLVRRIPALMGSSAVLSRATTLADTWPELHALADLFRTAERVVDAEAGRLLGDPDAARALVRAMQSRSRRVQEAIALAEKLLG